MLYRTLGKTGETVSLLGFGCMRLPLTDPKNPTTIDETKATALIEKALASGINYYDTAYPYHGGKSEEFLGRALGSRRKDVLLATKLPCWLVKERNDVRKYLEEQLERLNTNRIDMYLLHALNAERWKFIGENGIFDAMMDAKSEGLIRHIGFSFHDGPDVFTRIVDEGDWEFCQMQYNYLDVGTQAGEAGLKHAAAKGLGVIIMEPLRGGNLAANLPLEVKNLMNGMAPDRTPAEWGFRFVMEKKEVGLILSGMGRMEELGENLKIFSNADNCRLTDEEKEVYDKFRDILLARTAVPCTQCAYCQPCPAGIPIPDIFDLYNGATMFTVTPAMKGWYSRITEKSGPKNCTECRTCEAACPQKIEITAMLKKAEEVLATPKHL